MNLWDKVLQVMRLAPDKYMLKCSEYCGSIKMNIKYFADAGGIQHEKTWICCIGYYKRSLLRIKTIRAYR
jgi:hypothetical protein